jgi:carbamoyltransferase
MALAAYGGGAYVAKFRDVVHLQESGQFSLNRDYLRHDRYGEMRPFTRKFLETFGPPRDRDEPISDRHRDLAHALQTTIEETVVHVVRGLSATHSFRNLCLTGGVALNCVANTRILSDTDYQRVWVPPCASDTGAPRGGALWHYHQTLAHARQTVLTHPFYGIAYGDGEIRSALDRGTQPPALGRPGARCRSGSKHSRRPHRRLVPRAIRDGTARPRQPLHPGRRPWTRR